VVSPWRITLLYLVGLAHATLWFGHIGHIGQLEDFWLANRPPTSATVETWFLVNAVGRALDLMLLGVALYRLGIIQGAHDDAYYRRLGIRHLPTPATTAPVTTTAAKSTTAAAAKSTTAAAAKSTTAAAAKSTTAAAAKSTTAAAAKSTNTYRIDQETQSILRALVDFASASRFCVRQSILRPPVDSAQVDRVSIHPATGLRALNTRLPSKRSPATVLIRDA
jgi:hypothetical protein